MKEHDTKIQKLTSLRIFSILVLSFIFKEIILSSMDSQLLNKSRSLKQVLQERLTELFKTNSQYFDKLFSTFL